MYEKYFTANKEGWNKKTAIHKTSSFYDLEKFTKVRKCKREKTFALAVPFWDGYLKLGKRRGYRNRN